MRLYGDTRDRSLGAGKGYVLHQSLPFHPIDPNLLIVIATFHVRIDGGQPAIPQSPVM